MASYDSPPSPLSSSPSEPSRRTTTEHTTARSKARHSKHHHRSSSYLFHHSDIAQLLISEEREARELREAISTLTERVRLETSRADSAEQRLTSTLLKVKEATSTRLSVQQDFNRVSEELRLYKLQLENAQKEISKAQEVVDQLEKERYEAEECAARARTTARKLKEEKLVMQAREEGRKEGMQEGFERGRRLGFEEGRTEGYESGRAAALRELARSARVVEDPLPPPTRRPVSTRQSSSRLRQTTLPTDVPEDIRIVSPPSRPVTGTFTNIPTPEPVIVQTAHVSQYTPPLNPTDYIPDGWIPTLDDDKRIRLPPPHELNMPTTTPTTSPPAGVSPPVDPETPLLMVPPPPTPYADPSAAPSMPQPIAVPQYETGPPSASVEDYPSDTESSAQRTRPRPKRRSSSESQSTTISQFEILGPPIAPSARSVGGVERPGSVLSAIVEERERSSSGGNSPYAQNTSPGRPLSRPEPHNVSSALNPSTIYQLGGAVYTRPHSGRGSQSSESDPDLLSTEETRGRGAGREFLPASGSPPSRSRSRQTSRSVGSSNGGYNITVEPPSRPDSNHSRSSPSQNTTPAPHLLSAIDAEIPLQLPLEPPSLQQGDYDQDSGTAHPMHPANPIPSPSPVHNSHSGSTPSLNPIPNSHSYSLPSDITSQLPAGFMPLGPPTPTPSQSSIRPPSAAPSASGSAGRRGSGIYASPNPMTPSAVPLPPSTVPSVHRLYTPGPSPYTIPPRTPSIVAGGAGTPAPSQHHRQPSTASVDPVVVPLPASTIASYRSLGSGRKYSRSNLRRDSSSDDENDRSDDDDATTSSFDSLTTPKMRRRKVSSTTSATTRGAGAGGRQSERGSLVDGSGSKVGGRATPAYATAPTPPDIKYPLPPSSSGSISTPTPAPQAPARTRSRSGSVLSSTSTSVPMGSVVGRAAKVPLPPSSVGSPRSVYTKLSRKAGSAVGGRDR